MNPMNRCVFIPIFLAALVSACGSAVSKLQQNSPILGLSSSLREEFDPQTLNDDDFLLQPAAGTPVFEVPEAFQNSLPTPRKTRPRGYRVQIAAVLDQMRAQSFKTRSEQLLKQRVYVIYEKRSRLYKLHVGNCRTATEAETLRRDIKSKGHPEAFIVRSTIETAPSPYRIPTRRGYRIQIFSGSSRGAAEMAVKMARAALDREDIYIAFEPPYFKVHVGDFVTKDEADKFVQKARKQGYDTPFPVQTEIRAEKR